MISSGPTTPESSFKEICDEGRQETSAGTLCGVANTRRNYVTRKLFKRNDFCKARSAERNKSGTNCFFACLLIAHVNRKWDCTTITEVRGARPLFDEILDELKVW